MLENLSEANRIVDDILDSLMLDTVCPSISEHGRCSFTEVVAGLTFRTDWALITISYSRCFCAIHSHQAPLSYKSSPSPIDL